MTDADEAVSAVPAAAARVNGPEGEDLDWASVDWRRAEEDVRRLRQRIFTASQAGDLKKVRNLQKLMLRARSNTLLSVRRVTEINAGRATAGVDGKVVLLPQLKAALARWVQHRARPWTSQPVKRVFIPKPGTTKKRGLGIPVIVDRCLQAVALGALEPRVGSAVRAEVVRLPARPRLSRRDRGHLLHAQREEPAACVGARRGPDGGVRPHRP